MLSQVRHARFTQILSFFVVLSFSLQTILPSQVLAQNIADLHLPQAGSMISATNAFTPLMLRGITVDPKNPLQMDFIVNSGDTNLAGKELETESLQLVRYFLAALTTPENELWVNLSPYEKDRIIPQTFGETEMGRDLLAQDYVLKQLTSSLMYPESELGKTFWDRVYEQTQSKFGTRDIPLDTFNKVWILPKKAKVYEHGNSAFVVESELKVMLEEDFVAMQKSLGLETPVQKTDTGATATQMKQIIKEVIVPAIEEEVNHGEHFAKLRQVFNALILSYWYKQNLKNTLLSQIYVNQGKTEGVDVSDKTVNLKIYDEYLKAFKTGAYDLIKEDYDPASQKMVARKYFSGGAQFTNMAMLGVFETVASWIPEWHFAISSGDFNLIRVGFDSNGIEMNWGTALFLTTVITLAVKSVNKKKMARFEAIYRFIDQNIYELNNYWNLELPKSYEGLGFNEKQLVSFLKNRGWMSYPGQRVMHLEIPQETANAAMMNLWKEPLFFMATGLLLGGGPTLGAILIYGTAPVQFAWFLLPALALVFYGMYLNARPGAEQGVDETEVNAAMLQAVSKPAREFTFEVTSGVAEQLTRLGLRGIELAIKKIMSEHGESFAKQQEQMVLYLGTIADGIEGETPDLQAMIQLIENKNSESGEITEEDVKKIVKAGKNTADSVAKRIFQAIADKKNAIMRVRVSEGIADGVAESFMAHEVVFPNALVGEKRAEALGKMDGSSGQIVTIDNTSYVVVDVTVDVIEGTDQFVVNSGDKTLADIADSESGSTSTVVVGEGVKHLGNAPDIYAGGFVTNLGSEEAIAAFDAVKVDAGGGEMLSLRDPELYARKPEAIMDYLKFLADMRGQSLNQLQEEIVLMKRPREAAFLAALKKAQETIPGLKITEIKAGTVAHGLKASMTPQQFEGATGEKFGIHKTMITIGGSAEAFMNLAVAGALKVNGAVGGMRVYSGDMNGPKGNEAQDQSLRYQFSDEEKEDIRSLRPEDAEEIIAGKKVFTEADVQGSVYGAFSFISTNGVFKQPGTVLKNDNSAETRVLTIGQEKDKGPVVVKIVTHQSQNGNGDKAMLSDEEVAKIEQMLSGHEDILIYEDYVVMRNSLAKFGLGLTNIEAFEAYLQGKGYRRAALDVAGVKYVFKRPENKAMLVTREILTNVSNFPAPVGPYSAGVVANVENQGRILFTSGVGARSPLDNQLHTSTIEGQARQVFANIQAVLTHANFSSQDVTSVTIFLTEARHIDNVMAAAKAFLNQTSAIAGITIIPVKQLPVDGMMVEAKVTAVQGEGINPSDYLETQQFIPAVTGDDNIQAQAEDVMAQLKAWLEANQLSMDDVVITEVQVQNRKRDFSAINQVWTTYYPNGIYPARSTVETNELPEGVLLIVKASRLKKGDRAMLVGKDKILSTSAHKLGLTLQQQLAYKGDVESEPEIFQSLTAVESARKSGVLASLDIDRNSFDQYLNQQEDWLRQVGLSKEQVWALFDQTNFFTAQDIKNGSPVLVMRNDVLYHIDHINAEENEVYLAQGVVEALNRDGSKKNLFNCWLLKALLKARPEIAEKFIDLKDNVALAHFIQDQVRNFQFEYFKTLSQRNFVYDWESSVLPINLGVSLIGGKSYQIARYWTDNPRRNLISGSGTAEGHIRFMKSRPDVLQKIYQILNNLDVKDERARFKASQDIEKLIHSMEIPDAIRSEILEGAQKYGQSLAIRSSGRAEDTSVESEELKGMAIGASAGQYKSFLGEDPRVADERWRDDVASAFTDRVISYRDLTMVFKSFDLLLGDPAKEEIIKKFSEGDRNEQQIALALRNPQEFMKNISSLWLRDALSKNGYTLQAKAVEDFRQQFIAIENIALGVTFMPMADARISFVILGHDINTGFTAMNFQDIDADEHVGKGRIATITTTYNLGEAIVQGVTTPDSYKVHIFEDADGVIHANIIKKALGTKMIQAVYTSPVMVKFGLKDQALREWLKFIQDGKVSGAIGNALAVSADPKLARKALKRLMKFSPNETLDNISDEELELFNLLPGEEFSKSDLKEFIHLMKANVAEPFIRTMFTDVPAEMREEFAASDEEIIRIAMEYMQKAKDYPHLVDMEGASGFNFGLDFMPVTVQRRPSNVVGDIDNVRAIDEEYTFVKKDDLKEFQNKREVIGKGKTDKETIFLGDVLATGVPTKQAFSGVTVVIDEHKSLPDQFAKIIEMLDANQDLKVIIVTRETTPDYMPLLEHPGVVGVIATEGGGTSHAAIVSRELRLATVVGIGAFFERLKKSDPEKAKVLLKYLNTNGNTVTVDANPDDQNGEGHIYAGKLPISRRKIFIDIPRLPEIGTKIAYIMGMPDPMQVVAKMAQYDGFAGIALQRGEFPYAAEATNPRFGNAYDLILVNDYLNSVKDGNYANNLSPVRREALNKLISRLQVRQERREKGLDISYENVEVLIATFYGHPEKFWKSLNDFQRSDVQASQKDDEYIQRITNQIVGYVSYDSYFASVHGAALFGMASANALDKNNVVYRNIDFKKNEARQLNGSLIFDPDREPSTMIGERGGRWLLQPENEVMLRQEIRLLLQAVARGYKNVGDMFPFVSTPEEMDRLLTILEDEERKMSLRLSKELGREFPVFLREVGQMVELPSNVLLIDQFIDVIQKHERGTKRWFENRFGIKIKRSSFLSFGTNDLTQLTMLADRDNPKMKPLFRESHKYVIESIRHVINRARARGIKCGLCGQAIVNLASSLNPLDVEAAEELLLMLGETGGYAGTDYLLTLVAITRSASASLRNGHVYQNAYEKILAQAFESSQNRGAAARPLFEVNSVGKDHTNDLRGDLENTFVGDFILIGEDISAEDLSFNDQNKVTDDVLREKLGRLGAIIYTNDEQQDLMNRLSKSLRVPVIKVSSDFRQAVSEQNLFTNQLFSKEDFVSSAEAETLYKAIMEGLKQESDRTFSGIEDVVAALNGLMLDKDAIYDFFGNTMTWGYLSSHSEFMKIFSSFAKDNGKEKVKELTIDELKKSMQGRLDEMALKRFILLQKFGRSAPLPNFVTIDFTNQLIYKGRQLVKVEVKTKKSQIMFAQKEVSVANKQFERNFKVSDFYAKTEQRHPVSYLNSATSRADLKKRLKASIRSAYQGGNSLVYETLDLTSDKMIDLKGNNGFTQEEVNPALGFFGLDALMLDEQLREVFALEMETLSELIKEGLNISIQFNAVRISDSLQQAIEIAKAKGIDSNKTELGMNTAAPGIYLFPQDFISLGLKFITQDDGKVAQIFLAADVADNQRVRNFYTKAKIAKAIRQPVRNIRAVAAQYGTPIRLVTLEESIPAYADDVPTVTDVYTFKPQGDGITSITVMPDELQVTRREGTGYHHSNALLSEREALFQEAGVPTSHVREYFHSGVTMDKTTLFKRETFDLSGKVIDTEDIEPGDYSADAAMMVSSGDPTRFNLPDGRRVVTNVNGAEGVVEYAVFGSDGKLGETGAVVGDKPDQVLPEVTGQPKNAGTDNASLTKGGIDLNPAMFDSFKVEKDDSGMLTEINGTPIAEIRNNIQGLHPFIIKVTPMADGAMLKLLGLNDRGAEPVADGSDEKPVYADQKFLMSKQS